MSYDFSQLEQEIGAARKRVYRAGQRTPLQEMALEGMGRVFVKREDVSEIKAYKWRGAFNRMAVLSEAEKQRPLIAASAGNHAQGVALAARILGLRAKVFMPTTTPEVKRSAVQEKGGTHVEIVLEGDGFDNALAAAHRTLEEENGVFIHAYDDLSVIAGQATLADEIVDQSAGAEPFDVAYLQIGGGGMAGGVGFWLKKHFPGIRIVGVEGDGQASMAAAVRAGRPVSLEDLDIFCDGTAVRKAGELTCRICSEVIDEFITVSNEEVSDAIRLYWERLRCLQEPSGAMGLAGLRKDSVDRPFERALVVACGANMDFGKLSQIADQAGIGGRRRRHYRVWIPEQPGSMLHLFDSAFSDHSVIDFQYGKTDESIAAPVFGFVLNSEEESELRGRMASAGYRFEAADESSSVRFRAIPCNIDQMRNPVFLEIDFFEREGALRKFLSDGLRGKVNLCYFNYRYSGERVGRALVAIEFETEAEAKAFRDDLPFMDEAYRRCRILGEAL